MSDKDDKKSTGLDLDGDIDSALEAWDDVFDSLIAEDAKSASMEAVKAPAATPEATPDAAIADLLVDEELEFLGEATALGSLLGSAPPPLPDADATGEVPIEPAQATKTRGKKATVPPPSITKLAETAPTDDELFGDLPDAVPEVEAPTRKAGAAEGATRVADIDAMGLDEEAQKLADHVLRSGAQILRRDALNLRMGDDDDEGPGPADEFGGEATSVASAQFLDSILAAAEAEVDELEPEEPEVVQVDADFYDDIEIDADAAPRADSGRAERRINVHMLRRAETSEPEPDAEAGPAATVEIEADVDGEAAVSGVITSSAEDTDDLGLGPAGGGTAAARDAKSVDVERVKREFASLSLDDLDSGRDEVLSSSPRPAIRRPAPPSEPELEPDEPFQPGPAEIALEAIPEPEPVPEPVLEAAAEPEPEPIPEPVEELEVLEEPAQEAAPADASTSTSTGTGLSLEALLAEPDSAPALPASVLPEILPALKLDALDLPDDGAPGPGTGAPMELLAAYEREIERVDDPLAIARLRVEAGRLAEVLGDDDRAVAHYTAALEANPRSLLAARARRRVALRQWDMDELLATLVGEIELCTETEAHALRSWRTDLALALGSSDAVTPGDDVRGQLARLELAYVGGDVATIADALATVAAAVEDARLSEALAMLRGRVLEGTDDDRAIAGYRDALRADPASRAAIWALERIALRTGRVADAAAAAQRLLDGGLGDADPAMAAAVARRRAAYARQAGDADAWTAGLQQAAGLSAEDPSLMAELAAAFEQRGDVETAVRSQLARAAAGDDPAEQADAYRHAARLLEATAQGSQRHVDVLRRLCAVDPADAEASAALESALAAAGDVEGLLELDRAAVALDPRGAVFERVRIAQRLVAERRFEEAEQELEAARAAAPESPVLADTLVRTLAVAGRTERRAKLLLELAETESIHRDPEIAFIRAARAAEDLAYELMSADSALSVAGPAALERAREAWRRVLDIDPDSPTAHGALIQLAEIAGNAESLAQALAASQSSVRSPACAVGRALRRAALLTASSAPEAAAEVLRGARALDPAEPRASLALMIFHASHGEWTDAALTLDDRAVALGDGPAALAARFRAASMLFDHTEEATRVVEMLAPVVEQMPAFGPGTSLLERAHRRLGDATLLESDLQRKAAGGAEQPDAARFAALVREAELVELRVGDPRKAADLYQQALELRPADPLARAGLQRAAIAAGESAVLAQIALDELKHADDAGDQTAAADAYEALARIDAEQRGDVDSALLAWESAARHDPTRWHVLRSLERAYLERGAADELLAVYDRQIAAAAPADGAVIAQVRAAGMQAQGALAAEVRAEYRRAHELDPRARMPLLHLEREARAHAPSEELARLEEAIAAYFEGDDRARAAFLVQAGQTHQMLGDQETAIACFKTAAQALPGFTPALLGWRRAALRAGMWLDVAESALAQAGETAGDDERAALYHLAGVAFMDRALPGERAVAALRGALAHDPAHLDSYLRLRALFEEQAQHEDLAQLLEARLRVDDDEGARRELRHALARTYVEYLGDADAARRHLTALLTGDPDDEVAIARLAELAWDREEWPEAAEALLRRAKLLTDRAALRETLRKLGRIYGEHMPDARLALEAYQRVLELEPTDEEALQRISVIAAEAGEWQLALGACERLLQTPDRSAEGRIELLHRAGAIYLRGMNDAKRAERLYRAAVDQDPTSAAALDALVEFFRQAGDLRSLRVHLDMVAAAVRKRLDDDVLDGVAYRVLARALTAREDGAPGSAAAGMCAAELAVAAGGAEDSEQGLAATAARLTPSVAGLGQAEIDDLLFPRPVSSGLRHLLRAVDDKLVKQATSITRELDVGRGDRVRGGAVDQLVRAIAEQLGVRDVELYVTKRDPFAMAAEPGGTVKLVLGAEVASAERPQRVRFAAGRALKMAIAAMSVPSRMTAHDLTVMFGGLLRAFDDNFTPGGVDAGKIAEQAGKWRRAVSGGQVQELGPYALGVMHDFNGDALWRGIVGAANRAGLLACGSVRAAVEVLAGAGGYPDLSRATTDPTIADLLRFSVSEDHVALRSALRQS